MLTLLVALAALADPPLYVAGYRPKVGDKVVLARDEPGRRVMVVKDSGSAMGFKDYAVGDIDDSYEAIAQNPQVAEVDPGTAAQVVEEIPFGPRRSCSGCGSSTGS
ncbi:MAG: hypothetical protein U0871_11995 [Gemmataceae bacterium]